MTHHPRLPEAYILASPDQPDSEWLGNLLRACVRTCPDLGSIEIIDELYANAEGDILSVAVKLTTPMNAEQFRVLSQELLSPAFQKSNVRMIRGQPEIAALVDPTDLRVEYFRREFSKDSRMVAHTDSCVRITHLPTGKVARSTQHRSRGLNHDEALLLLQAELGAAKWAGAA